MRVLVSIDDTDNIESRGTGELASLIARTVENRGWGKSYGITRHQLLIHPDIPYTSHNSAMCFAPDIDQCYLEKLILFTTDFLLKESAEGSDPGLCVAVIDWLNEPELLVNFGLKAKKTVINKEEAYFLASRLAIHLSEHGGTGQGVIGALAGAGLRLSGNDGRFKGKHKIKTDQGLVCVGDIMTQAPIDIVKTLEGFKLSDSEIIALWEEEIKTVLLDNKSVLLVCPNNRETVDGVKWRTYTKQQLKSF